MARPLRYDFEASIGYHVVPTAHALQRALNEELAPLGVTYRQWQVLAWLVRDPDVCQADLARHMHIEGPTLAGILHRMERDGWLRREAYPDDKRCNRLVLQPAAEPLWRKMAAAGRRVRRRAMRGITREQFEAMRQVLGHVRANLERTEVKR